LKGGSTPSKYQVDDIGLMAMAAHLRKRKCEHGRQRYNCKECSAAKILILMANE
jgi:hypothetical protein